MTHRLKTLGIVFCLCVLSPTIYACIPEPDGQEPPPEESRYDAICAVGKRDRMAGEDALDWFNSNGEFDPLRSGGNTGTGVLIAPNLVLTARHLWSFGDDCPVQSIDDYLCEPWESCNTNRHWVVRFRRNPDGTVGTMNEFPYPPNDIRGPGSFFHVDVIGAIELTDCTDSVIIVLDENVTHIDPLPLVASDARVFRHLGLNNPNPTHLGADDEPDVTHPLVITGWGSSTPDSNAQGSGQFRVRSGEGEATFKQSGDIPTLFHGTQPVSLHDSGSPILTRNQAGDPFVSMTLRGFSGGGDRWVIGGASPSVWITSHQLDGLVNAPSWFDQSGSADPSDEMYGMWNGLVDLVDVFYVAAETTLGNLTVDFTGSINPTSPAYGVPDGVADETDYEYFVGLLGSRPVSDVGPWPPLPLAVGDTDNTADGRLTESDYDPGLSQDQLEKFDFDRDGKMGLEDLARAADINARFGHGVLADLDSDGDHDTDDLEAIRIMLKNGNPWDGQMSGDPQYDILLDSNLDGYTTILDRRDIAAMFLPGEVAEATDIFDLPDSLLLDPPDFRLTRWDRLAALWHFVFGQNSHITSALDTSGSGEPGGASWGVPDEITDSADLKHFLYRQYEMFGPDSASPAADILVRMWPGFDANTDGRFTFDDFKYLQALDPDSEEALMWDLDGDGVFEPYVVNETGSDAIHLFVLLMFTEWGQDALGDFDGDMNPSECCIEIADLKFCFPEFCVEDGDATPDCLDYWEMYDEIRCRQNNLFDGRSFFSEQDEGYLRSVDADLDGDNDLEDQYWVILHGLRIADINLDSMLDQHDIDTFLDLYNTGDPVADIASPLGTLNIFDIMEYLNRYSSNTCGSRTGGLPRPCTLQPKQR